MSNEVKTSFWRSKVGLLLFVAATWASSICSCGSTAFSSDAELIGRFQADRPSFETLARMAQEDHDLIRIAPHFTWTKASVAWPRPDSELGFSVDRWNRYRELFVALGARKGVLNYQPDEMRLIVDSEGMVTGGSSKGYAFCSKAPEPLADSLDGYRFDPDQQHWIVYKRIEGNWYIYYEVD